MTVHKIFTVSEITSEIRRTLEKNWGAVYVSGEISYIKKHSSGHVYFSISDQSSQLNCTLWRSYVSLVSSIPEKGKKVTVYGKVSVYDRMGQYQLNARNIVEEGEGLLAAEYEKLKKKLTDEGIFDVSKKRPLPDFPLKIGVVTSRTGAALQDIINVIKRRSPQTTLVIRNAIVQGEKAPDSIKEAIEDFNIYGDADLLIVGRGGGSPEDLWAFNTEPVVRAVAESGIPVISAVGHETDVSLSDFAADVRAPTPSAAAEIAVRDNSERRTFVSSLIRRLFNEEKGRIIRERDRYNSLCASYAFRIPVNLIEQNYQRIDGLRKMLEISTKNLFSAHESRIRAAFARLDLLSPLKILSRGYSVLVKKSDGAAVKTAADISPKDILLARFHEGSAELKVERCFYGPGKN
ncbi:MAG: exodeoxyribonuclease VII large subunit [Fibrobacterota bacterium]